MTLLVNCEILGVDGILITYHYEIEIRSVELEKSHRNIFAI